jgi:hypothetical protein
LRRRVGAGGGGVGCNTGHAGAETNGEKCCQPRKSEKMVCARLWTCFSATPSAGVVSGLERRVEALLKENESPAQGSRLAAEPPLSEPGARP